MARLPRIGRLPAAVLVAAVAVLALYAFTVKAVQDYYAESSPDRSVFNKSAAGLSIWYGYLEALDLAPKTLRDFGTIPKDAVLVVAGPFESTPSAEERERLARWVRDGGELVLVGYEAELAAMPLELGVGPAEGEDHGTIEPLLPSVYTSDVKEIVAGRDRLEPRDARWVAHFADDTGDALISAVWGKGRVTWLSSAYTVSNEGIGHADNAVLAVLLAGSGHLPVYFDEYHHGYRSGQTVWDRLDLPGRSAVLLLLLGTAVLVLALGRRLGPPVPEAEAPAARTTAYIATLADLYRKAGARSEALATLEEGLERAMRRRYGTVGAGSAGEAARKALDRSAALRAAGTTGRAEFLAAARELRRARQEVEGRDG